MIEQFFGQPIGIYDLDVPDDLNKLLVDFEYHCYELQTKHVDSAELAQYTCLLYTSPSPRDRG